MSRICELTGTRRIKRNKIAIERSKITRRTKGFANVNLQMRRFKTTTLGSISLRISNRTMRTVEKYGGIEGFLTSVKRGHLTQEAKQMRKKIQKKTPFVKKEQK